MTSPEPKSGAGVGSARVAQRRRRTALAASVPVLCVLALCATSASSAVRTRAAVQQQAGGLVRAPSPVSAARRALLAATARTWLQEINYYRVGAGLKAVTNAASWGRGIHNHLRYLEKTPAKYFTGQYQSVHTENPKSPFYTKSGALEASRSDLLEGSVGDALGDIDNWLTAPFHAIGMLRYGLKKVAFAEGYIGAGLDVLGGLTYGTPDPKPIFFPGNNVTTSLVSYGGGELPDPLQSCHWSKSAKRKPVGLPIIALLPTVPSRALVARLRLPNGKVERTKAGTLCLLDQFTYHSTDKVYGPTGLAILEGDHAVVLFPSGDLRTGRYNVTIYDTQKITYAWRFTVKA
jgi:hypothetical protein